jgi:iron(III) transport system substrate-binding protein
MKVASSPFVLGAFLMATMVASQALAQSPDWQKTWDATLAAAKKEGKVVAVGSPDPVARNELIPKFVARYGIPVEYIATGSGGQMAARLNTERKSGIFSVDVFLNGAGPTVTILYAEKMLDPLRPQLILPEVVEGKNWKRGEMTFIDPGKEYIMQLFSSVDGLIFINTQYVKLEEMRTVDDLVNPKWRGKISTEDPFGSGTGINKASHFYIQMGPDWVRKLYIDQKPGISRERRQLTDWLARGTYPICLTCRQDDMKELQKEGYGLVEVYSLEGMKNRVTATPLMLSLANKAPNPNAARVFANWMATREALEIYSRDFGAATLRSDVDESHLDPNNIPKPGVSYADDTDFEWVAKGRVETGEKVRATLKKQ